MPMFAAISKATAADHSILTAPTTGGKYRVLGFALVAAGAVTVTWKSGSTALTGAMSLITGTPLVAPLGGNSLDTLWHFETAPGEALVLTLGGAVQISGWLVYDVVG